MELGVALARHHRLFGRRPAADFGVAGTRMSVSAMKRLWPVFAAPKVRAWVEEHVRNGTVERLVIATNAPMSTLKSSGPPVPDDGLAIEIVGHGAEIRPVEGLPSIRDADFNVRITGRTAVVNIGRGNVELSPGRKLSITNGVFEVPDTFPKAPPAKARFRLDGSVPAAAELLALGAAARLFRHAARSRHQPRHAHRAGDAGAAAQGRSRARLLDLYDRHGRDQLRRRARGDGAEGRGGDAQGQRQQSGLLDQGRRQDQRRCGHISITASRATPPMPRSASRPRSTKTPATSSASISPAFSAGRCRSSSTAACRPTAATAGSRSTPI